MTTYVYIQSERSSAYSDGLYTVGFYDPDGKWHAADDYASEVDAANRVIELNGGVKRTNYEAVNATTTNLLKAAAAALRSYQYGNASTELAKSIADMIEAKLGAQE